MVSDDSFQSENPTLVNLVTIVELQSDLFFKVQETVRMSREL